jgi:hypothetical protein
MWVAIPLVAGLLLTTADFVGSGLERYGSTYGSEPALTLSRRLAPWRMLTPLLLAKERAFDYRQGDHAAAADARRLVLTAVRAHSWYPMVRLTGTDVYLLLNDLSGARRLTYDDLRLYPHDALALDGGATLALRAGDLPEARRLARLALMVDPNLASAQKTLRAAS